MRHRREGGRILVLLAVLAPLIAGCASTGSAHAIPHPFPMPSVESDGQDLENGDAASTTDIPLINTALSLRGRPYRNGGSDVTGFDCSGFTQYVFARHGVRLPREVRDQFKLGETVARPDVAVGDLMFFSTTAAGPSHVAIALGGEEFVHAPSASGVVRVERLSTRYWSVRLVGIRRLPIP